MSATLARRLLWQKKRGISILIQKMRVTGELPPPSPYLMRETPSVCETYSGSRFWSIGLQAKSAVRIERGRTRKGTNSLCELSL